MSWIKFCCRQTNRINHASSHNLILAVFANVLLTRATSITVCPTCEINSIQGAINLASDGEMGFTGAVFQKFLGSSVGMLMALGILMIWMILPMLGIKRVSLRKDF